MGGAGRSVKAPAKGGLKADRTETERTRKRRAAPASSLTRLDGDAAAVPAPTTFPAMPGAAAIGDAAVNASLERVVGARVLLQLEKDDAEAAAKCAKWGFQARLIASSGGVSAGGSSTAAAPTRTAPKLSAETRRRLDLGHVTQEEEFDFREIFDIIDLDHGGTIDTHELTELLDLLSIRHTPNEVADLMLLAGTDDAGDIPFENFLRAVTRKPNRRYNKQMVMDAFEDFAVPNLPVRSWAAAHVLAGVAHQQPRIARAYASLTTQLLAPRRVLLLSHFCRATSI